MDGKNKITGDEWEEFPGLKEKICKTAEAFSGMAEISLSSAKISFSNTGNIKVVSSDIPGGMYIIRKGSIPAAELAALHKRIPSNGHAIVKGYNRNTIKSYLESNKEILTDKLREETNVKDLTLSFNKKHLALCSTSFGNAIRVSYGSCPYVEGRVPTEYFCETILKHQREWEKEAEKSLLRSSKDAVRKAAEKEIVKKAGEMLGLDLSYEMGKVFLRIEGKSLCGKEFEILSKENSAYLICTDNGVKTVMYKPERRKEEEDAFFEKLRKAEFECDWKDFFPNEVNKIKKMVQEYAAAADPLKNGARKPSDTISMVYSVKKGAFLIKSSACSCTIREGKVVEKRVSPKYRFLSHLSTLKRYEACANLLDETLKEDGINFTYKKGKGILFGETALEVTTGDGRFSFDWTWKTEPYSASLTVWKKNFKNQMGEICEKLEEIKKEEEERVNAIFRPFSGDFLAEDIAEFVTANERYITQNAVAEALRGISIKLQTQIAHCANDGKYNLVSQDEVMRAVDHMKKGGLLYAREVDGYYGSFYVLKTTHYTAEFLRREKKLTYTERDAERFADVLKNGERLTDRQAQAVFAAFQKKEKTIPGYLLVLKLAGNRGFICRYQKAYEAYFDDMPREIKTICRMKKETSEDPFEQKVMRLLLRTRKE